MSLVNLEGKKKLGNDPLDESVLLCYTSVKVFFL